MTRRTIDLRGPDPDNPLFAVNPVFGVQLNPDEALVGLRETGGPRFGYFRVREDGAELLDLSLPSPLGAYAAPDGEVWIIAGSRQLFRGRPDTGFLAVGSTRAVARDPVWIDGAPDGSELIALSADGVAEIHRDGRWSEVGRYPHFLNYHHGAVLWIGPGEALFTREQGDLGHLIGGEVRTIRKPSNRRVYALARHPNLGILAGTEGGTVLRLEPPGQWEPLGNDALTDDILGLASLGDGFLATGIDNGLALFHPRIGYCSVGAFGDARSILRLGRSVLLVHRAPELRLPVSLELFEPLPLSETCEVLR